MFATNFSLEELWVNRFANAFGTPYASTVTIVPGECQVGAAELFELFWSVLFWSV